MGREQMYALGAVLGSAFEAIENATPEPGRHGFVRASTIALTDENLSHRSFRVLLALESYCWGEDRESWATGKAGIREAYPRSNPVARLTNRDPVRLSEGRNSDRYRLTTPHQSEGLTVVQV
jgi:hypothetical protein